MIQSNTSKQMCSSSHLCLKTMLIDYLSILRSGFKVAHFVAQKTNSIRVPENSAKSEITRRRLEGTLLKKCSRICHSRSRSRWQNFPFLSLIYDLLHNLTKLPFEQLFLQAKNWPGRPAHEGLSKGEISGHFLDLIAARQKQ